MKKSASVAESDLIPRIGQLLKVIHRVGFQKMQQVTYCETTGIFTPKDGSPIITPSRFNINGSKISHLEYSDGDWYTDNESNRRLIELKLRDEIQANHQSALKKLGLPTELAKLFGQPFVLTTISGAKISGSFASISFITEKGEKSTRLSPANSLVLDKLTVSSSVLKTVDYLEYWGEKEWVVVCKNIRVTSGKIKLL